MFTLVSVRNRRIRLIVVLIGLVAFVGAVAIPIHRQLDPVVRLSASEKSFQVGEELKYAISYGIFTIGEGSTKIDNKVHIAQSNPCYRVSLSGKTTGLISWLAKVHDRFSAYVDTATLLTRVAYSKVKEGNYRKNEMVVFDHAKRQVKVKEQQKKTNRFKEPKTYPLPRDTRDLLSSFLYVRTFDFHTLDRGDTIAFNAFVQDTTYHFQIIYRGVEIVKTSLGSIRCVKLTPVMPANKLFKGENSISCWISDDKNRIPVKLWAKMFVGSFKIELLGFRKLKHPFNIIL